MPLGLATICWQ